MSTSVPSPTGAHLVGSVPLADAAEVFTVAAGELGPTCAGSPTARPGAGRSGSPGRATSSPATPTSRSTPRPRGSMRRWTASGFATGWTPAACASSDWATRTPPSPPTRLRAAPARGRDPRPHPLPGQPPDAGGAVTQFVSPRGRRSSSRPSRRRSCASSARSSPPFPTTSSRCSGTSPSRWASGRGSAASSPVVRARPRSRGRAPGPGRRARARPRRARLPPLLRRLRPRALRPAARRGRARRGRERGVGRGGAPHRLDPPAGAARSRRRRRLRAPSPASRSMTRPSSTSGLVHATDGEAGTAARGRKIRPLGMVRPLAHVVRRRVRRS